MKKTGTKILEAASKLFSEFGYNGASTKKIAEDAGVNEITLFRHFKNKGNLLQTVIRHYSYEGNIINKISSEIKGNLKEDLEIFAEVYYMFLVNNIKLYKIQMREISDDGKRFTNSIEYTQFMKKYLIQQVENGCFIGDPDLVSKGIVAMIMGVFTLEVYSPDIYEGVPNRAIIKLFIDDILNMYCK